jgi:hypothetical protein
MNIKDELIKYFSQLQSGGGSDFGINAKPKGQLGIDSVLGQPTQEGNFGQLNPQVQPIGSGGVNQLNTITDAMSNPIDAQAALKTIVDKKDPSKKASEDMQKKLVASSMSTLGNTRQQAQPPLQMINAQQAFAQMPDATQPQQVQEFKPEQMAMMLRKRYGNF